MNEILFETKKIVFYREKLYIKPKEKYVEYNDIERMFYAKWSIKNYFKGYGYGMHETPGFLFIILKKCSDSKNVYCVHEKYENMKKLYKVVLVKNRTHFELRE